MDLSFSLRSAFLALPLEGPAKWQFQAVQAGLEPFADCLSFQNPQSPHLTLRFWPSVMEIEYNDIALQAVKIAAQSQPFTLQIIGADTFGRTGDERVLYLTIAFSPELADLKKRCPWPNPPREPDFHPHITLARIKHSQRFAVHRKAIFKALSDAAFPFPVDQLRLYAEVNGVKQAALADYSFNGVIH